MHVAIAFDLHILSNQENVYGADVMTQSHCVSSPGSHDECRTAPDSCRALDQSDGLEP